LCHYFGFQPKFGYANHAPIRQERKTCYASHGHIMDNKNNQNKGFMSSFNNKYFRIGGYSTLIAFIVIAVAIVINLIVAQLPANLTKLDTSSLEIFTLSDQTKEIIGAIGEDITIYHIAQSGAEDDTLSELVDRYAAVNSRIKVKKIDPVVNPNFVSAYTSEGVAENSLIVESAKRFKVVQNSDIYVVNYSYDANYNVSTSTAFAGESAITSALDYVTSEVISKLYILSGHGEGALSQTMSRYIESENIDTEALSLLTTPEVPADASCLLINNPTGDLNDAETEAILKYMKNGGSVVVISMYTQTGAGLPNLYSIANYYGIEVHDGLVLEGSSNHYMQVPYYIIPKVGSHEIVSTLENSNFFTFMPQSMGLSVMDKLPRTTVNVTPLLFTTESAYLKSITSETLEKTDSDLSQSFALAMAASENKTKLVWYTSPVIIDESIDQIVSGGNSNFFMASLTWICGEGSSVSIASKTMQVAALMLTETESNLWAVITVAVIPLLFAGCGMFVWMKRRKR